MRALIGSNPSYRAVTVMKVNWDRFSRSPIARKLGVRSQATLVMFSRSKEVGRVVGRTSAGAIEPLFTAAVS